MLDAHAHIERGSYTKEWIDQFVQEAQNTGIHELHLLEHSFRFVEFRHLYNGVGQHKEAGKYQRKWLATKFPLSLEAYKAFVTKIRKVQYPIEVKYGLEICYFPEHEREIRELVSDGDWDFLTGSIHWIDGFGFDHPKNIPIWQKSDVDMLYHRYYELMIQAVRSNIFDFIAHPDSIKCFNYYPTFDLNNIYIDLGKAAKKHRVSMEFNNGLFINYGHKELGLNQKLLEIFIRENINVITASDAHKPEDVGKCIREAKEVIQECCTRMRR